MSVEIPGAEIAAAGLKDEEYKKAAAASAARTLFRSDNTQENAIATGLKNLFAGGGGITSTNLTEDLYKRLKFQFNNLITTDANSSALLEEGLKPISSFIGSTLLNLTGLQENPLGSKFDLPQTLSSMLEKMNPQLHAKFKSSYDSFNTQKLSELPSQLFGNVKQLSENPGASGTESPGATTPTPAGSTGTSTTTPETASAAPGGSAIAAGASAGASAGIAAGINVSSAINSGGIGGGIAAATSKITLPQGLQDSYRGLEDLMAKANDFVNNAMESITKQLNTVVKKIPPEVTQLLGNTDQFTGQIDGLVKQFGNIEQLNQVTEKLGIGNLDFNSFIKENPFNALQSLGASFGNFESLDQYTSFLKSNPLQAIAQGGVPGANPGDSPTPQGGVLNKPAGSVVEPPSSPATSSAAAPTPVPFSLPNTKESLLKLLPQEITSGLGNIGNISGFGFTGNIPFGLQTALQGIGSNVFGTILSKFAGQLPFLASGILGTTGLGSTPSNYPSNEAVKTEAPDSSVKYTTDPTSGTIIKPTPPKPVYADSFAINPAPATSSNPFAINPAPATSSNPFAINL